MKGDSKAADVIGGLAHIGIPTEELEVSRRFYKTLGFSTAGAVDHFAMETEDPEACLSFVKEQGYRVLEDGIQVLELSGRTVTYFNILGPNGEKIEFCRNEYR